MPQRYVAHLQDAGFDVVSVANNHSGDFNEKGRTQTAKTLSDSGIQFAGFQSHPYTFYGENRGNAYAFARMAIDAGADVVLGSGPHVTRAVDLYKNRFIAYSLGNFCTYGMFNLDGPNGMAPLLALNITEK